MEVKQGDLVVSIYGQQGIIAYICNCDRCEERKYHEPRIQWEDGSGDYISQYEAEHNYPSFYSIGDHIFKFNARPADLLFFIADKQKELRSLLGTIESATSLLQKVMK